MGSNLSLLVACSIVCARALIILADHKTVSLKLQAGMWAAISQSV